MTEQAKPCLSGCYRAHYDNQWHHMDACPNAEPAPALDKGLVKNADPQNKSRKFAEYVPAWA